MFAAGVYELGRPERMNADEKAELEARYAQFCAFADERVARTGRCHVTEVAKALKRHSPKLQPSDRELRSFIANWAPEAERSSSGYYKGLSVQKTTDPFTGELV